MFDRTLKILSPEVFSKIQNSKVLLIGLGGVGGYALEALVRSGFLFITVVDGDANEVSNLNRQILSTKATLGLNKVDVAVERAKSIHEECEVTAISKFLKDSDITEEFLRPFDIIIDACDTMQVKVKLFLECTRLQKKIISSMGTANRTHPECFELVKLSKTRNDPVAKILRRELRDNKKALQQYVVCSRELPKKQKELGTIASVPMAAGAILVSYIINILSESHFQE